MKKHAVAFIMLAALVLTGCASTSSAGVAGGSTPSTAPTVESTSTPTPTPTTPEDSITVGVDALVGNHDGESVTYLYTEPELLLDFVAEVTGLSPEGEDIPDPWGNGEVWGKRYTWDGITVSAMTDGAAGVRITAATLGGIPVSTSQGIRVGSTSDDVVSAGGFETWSDGASHYFGVEPQPVEGTQSLSRPGEMGQAYIDVTAVDGVVTAIAAPANDYSDL
ncbi:MAG: hypothetical protein ACTHNQ_15690 [Microbacterium sp.]|uniref:hypothetical protein n=1 Tax=Microbacterium sp. TaxID=51671 RepID=UPI003F818469